MTGIFKQKNPINIILLLVFGIFIKLPLFLHPYTPVVHSSDSRLFQNILDFLRPYHDNSPQLYPILTFSFLFTQAIMLVRVINNHRMTTIPGYLPAMAYLLITSLFPEWNYFSAPLLVNTLFLFILSWVFKVYNLQNASGMIFNMGFVLGVAGFIYFPSLVFVVWMLLSFAIMRPFRLKEWLVCILGITTPYYFYSIYLFFTGHWNWGNLFPSVNISVPAVQQSAWLAGAAALIAIPFLMGGYYVQDNLRRMLIQVRKGWSLLLLYLLAAIVIPFINTNDSFENWIIAAVPIAAFHACTYLYATYRIIPLLLFWLTTAFVIFYQYYGPGW